MKRSVVAIGAVLGGCTLLLLAQPPAELPTSPLQNAGLDISPAFEGWFKNADGSFSLLVGYFNRNLKEDIDIPIGVNNHVDPGGPDQGQPTHFLPRRQWGVFAIKVPKDFGQKKVTWTLVSNGQTNTIPFDLNPVYEINPFSEVSMNNTPPYLGFSPAGPFAKGPIPVTANLPGRVGDPVTLNIWAADDAKVLEGAKKPPPGPAVSVTWTKYRGPGTVTFAKTKPPVEKAADFNAPQDTKVSGKATTTAIFSEPGEYVLHAVANDWSGDGGRGFQCCWTNAMLKVTVKPATSASK